MRDILKIMLTGLILGAASYFLGMSVAKADTIKVAVIDTGFDFSSQWAFTDKDSLSVKYNLHKPTLCKTGHMDFAMDKTDVNYSKDNHGHGTHVAGLIAKYAGKSNYCLLILKYYDPKAIAYNNLLNEVKALNYAIEKKVDIINYSGGGIERSETECKVIKKALDKGIIIVAAAGNEQSNLDKKPYYPAMCDDRVIMVANIDVKNRTIASSSNLNANTVAIGGVNSLSLLPGNQFGYLTGTSQSTAIVTGKLVQTLNIANTKRGIKRDARTVVK